MLRTLVIFCTLLLLWHIVAELNHAARTLTSASSWQREV